MQSINCNKTNRGIISVVLEGNPLPVNCKEIKEIVYCVGLQTSTDKRVPYAKRPPVRRQRTSIK